ncbi:flavin-containing monooxygenase [Cypionkella sinensis]|uniref:Flavin-containing monooxygenase n=1 Tax=Cypionkella sinensis TaxID=1756043 RepID=A0ABV7J1J4_9RHOB
MPTEKIDTLIIGGGQAGLAMSAQLGARGQSHLVLERHRIAERWRSERWDSLVANGPAWHDRFPILTFDDLDPDAFAPKERIAAYFEAVAEKIAAPIRCGVEVTSLEPSGDGFVAETSQGRIEARNVVVATGPFQKPLIPTLVPESAGVVQMHSNAYRNPGQLPEGAVLVVGAGSSGSQIADELMRAGKKVFLSVGPHDRPPRAYRGKDFCWWLGVLGQWDQKVKAPGTEHVTIAVSGARGGHTVDFHELAARGMTLLGRVGQYQDGVLAVGDDLGRNVRAGNENYLATLALADAYAAEKGLDLPLEEEAKVIGPEPDCVSNPIRALDLAAEGVTSIIWATGFGLDYGWLKVPAFDEQGRPAHDRGISTVPGLYFLGLPWLSRRASPFIWGVWHDADYLAEHIAAQDVSTRGQKIA